MTPNRRTSDLGGDDRTDRFARRQARERQRALLSHAWKWVLLIPAVTGVVALVISRLAALPHAEFIAGVIAASGFWVAWYEVVVWSGSARLLAAASAEQLTAAELRRLSRRGWRAVHGLVLKGNADVDHVVIGPGGLLVVETKYRSREWNLGDADDPDLRGGVAQVRENCDRVDLWLKTQLGAGVGVPVLVAWGPQLVWDSNEPATIVNGVSVVPGPHLRQWLTALPSDTLAATEIEAAWQKISRHAEGRDQRDRELANDPPRLAVDIIGSFTAKFMVGLASFTIGLLLAAFWGLAGLAVGATLAGVAALLGWRFPPRRPYAYAWIGGQAGVMLLAAYAVTAAKVTP